MEWWAARSGPDRLVVSLTAGPGHCDRAVRVEDAIQPDWAEQSAGNRAVSLVTDEQPVRRTGFGGQHRTGRSCLNHYLYLWGLGESPEHIADQDACLNQGRGREAVMPYQVCGGLGLTWRSSRSSRPRASIWARTPNIAD
jgi:hypothetical protein